MTPSYLPTTAPRPAKKPVLESSTTSYVVLRQNPTSDNWAVENSNVPAASAEAAIRLACKNDDIPAGTYVAVPARSWKPVKVSAVQSVVLKLEDAG